MKCPQCKSPDVEHSGQPLAAAGKIWHGKKCQACGYYWSDNVAPKAAKLEVPAAPPAAAPAPVAELKAVPPAAPAGVVETRRPRQPRQPRQPSARDSSAGSPPANKGLRP